VRQDLRVAREMPRLRQFRPVARATPGFSSFTCRLPKDGPVNPDIRVAVFDGGVKANPGSPGKKRKTSATRSLNSRTTAPLSPRLCSLVRCRMALRLNVHMQRSITTGFLMPRR
jgi:hypothetical protein